MRKVEFVHILRSGAVKVDWRKAVRSKQVRDEIDAMQRIRAYVRAKG